MNEISTDSNNQESSAIAADNPEINYSVRLLPRSAWNSHLAYLKIMFRAKKALERIEKEAGIVKG
ncbi:MAG: hypothetical protein PUP93_09775 [Rhizonema sp. NSF051]|nr:hypothetical protein [Rhizonema sp. NSF051]